MPSNGTAQKDNDNRYSKEGRGFKIGVVTTATVGGILIFAGLLRHDPTGSEEVIGGIVLMALAGMAKRGMDLERKKG